MGIKDFSEDGIGQSKWVWSKSILSGEPLEKILAIADDLDFETAGFRSGVHSAPSLWEHTTDFKLFVSHISKDKDKAMRLRECLKPYAISAFVAHEDIEPTKPWETEIRRGLFCMDALVSLHTKGFSQSNWTQQELGFALGRGKKTIALRMGEDPTAFLSREQAVLLKGRRAEGIAKEIDRLLSDDPNTKTKLDEAKRAKLPKAIDDEFPF